MNAWRIDPAIIALARRPALVRLQLPSGGANLALTTRNFEPREGFTYTEDGRAIPIDNPDALSYYWYGAQGGIEATITVVRGSLNAVVSGDGFRYSIVESQDRDSHTFREIDLEEIHRSSCPTEPVADTIDDGAIAAPQRLRPFDTQGADAPGSQVPAEVQNLNVTVTVLFLYTPAALALVGGSVASLEPKIQASLDQLNQALQNSGQANFIRVVRTGPAVFVNYDETPQVADPLQRFGAHRYFMVNAGGQTISLLRDQYEADIAVMLVADSGTAQNPVYGIAFTQRPDCANGISVTTCAVGPQYEPFSLIAASQNFIDVDYTLAHEVGHTFGSEHDPTVPGSASPEGLASFLYSYGHRVSQVAMDVMGSPYCENGQAVCTTRRLQYANPSVPFIGTTLPSGTTGPYVSSDGSRSRNNSLTFRLLVPTNAGFRGPAEPARLHWDSFE